MSRVILHRPARMRPDPLPEGELSIQQPPPGQARTGFTWWPQLLMPLVSLLGSGFFIVYNPNPLYIAITVLMSCVSIALSVTLVAQQRSALKGQLAAARSRYAAYLDRVAGQAAGVARAQDRAGRFLHPGLTELLAIAGRRVRVWERRAEDADFATVRVGAGPVPLATPVRFDGEQDLMSDRDARLVAAARQVVEAHRTVPDQPVVVDLRTRPVLSLIGPARLTRGLARRLVAELATLCAPEDLRVAVFHPREAAAEWEFVKWLPHAAGDGWRPLLCDSAGELSDVLVPAVVAREEAARRSRGLVGNRSAAEESQQRLLVIVDGFSAGSPVARLDALQQLTRRAGALGASLVFCVEAQRDEPPAVDVRVRLGADGRFSAEDDQGGRATGRLDAEETSAAVVEAIARRLAPLQLSERDARTALSETCRLVELLGAGSVAELDLPALWARHPREQLLRVPVGAGTEGQVVHLDLKEADQGGMGPHGLVVGATGSGKSELLRTLVSALAATHPPDLLGFVLVDFKGGAAFAGLADLPHVAGMITNLADDLTVVDRVYAALFGEVRRRQQVLRRAGNLDGIRAYHALREAGRLPDSDPLPYLLVIVDEFGELLASRPDFVELFVAIGRIGRSLGIHLVLASQRLEQGRLRGLESHVSYRVCLRTFTAAESQAAIGTSDAYHLPTVPGSAYVQVPAQVYERFRAALASAPERPGAAVERRRPGPAVFTAHGLEPLERADSGAAGPGRETGLPASNEMTSLIRRIAGLDAGRVHQVWLPPLPPKVPLGRLLPPLGFDRRRGTQALGWSGLGSGRVPIGLLDLPLEQAQRPFAVDFTGWAGHLVVVGAPQTGKSTLLRTLALSLIATHTPNEARIYAVDYGGGGLLSLAGAPHVGGVAGRLELDRVRRTVDQVRSLVDERERRHRELEIDSLETLRRRRALGEVPPDLGSEVFLLVDGLGVLREEDENLELELRDIAARGLRVACHLVLTANRWTEVRPALRDNIPGRLELRLNDPVESEIDRRGAAAIPRGINGRALAPSALHLQVAVPELGASVEDVVTRAARAWPGTPAPPVRMLPAAVRLAELPQPRQDRAAGVPVGVDEFELQPVYLDLSGSDPHFLIFGDAQSGKTTFFRTFLSALQARKGPAEAMVLVVDYRRTLLGATRPEQLWAYCGNGPAAIAAVRELADGIVERLPPSNLSPEMMATRSWWSGPDIYIIVDDYDLVTSPAGNPLLPLTELLAQGQDIGLHVLLARRVGGIARTGTDQLLNRLRELRVPGLLLAGDPVEGPVMGRHRASPQPPGRGLLVLRRDTPRLVQIATEEAPAEGATQTQKAG